MTMKQSILTIIESHAGIKDRDLVLNVMGLINPVKFDSDMFNAELEYLVDSREVVRIKYSVPFIEEIKCIHLPKGSVVL